MSYTRNLGRVKGKKGNYFIPTVSIDKNNGKLSFHWEETIVANEESQSNNSVTTLVEMPIFIPNYNSGTGELSFTPTVPFIKDGLVVNAGDDTQFKWNIRGPRGYPGTVSLKMEHTNKTIEELESQLETELEQLENEEIEEISFQTDTIYFTITNDQNIENAYIYDNIKKSFFMMEGISLSEYYKKNETYNKTEVDDFIDIQNTYLEKIYELLDVPNDTYNINGQEISNDMLDALIESKMEDYIKLEDTSYEQHNGTIYFIPYSGD